MTDAQKLKLGDLTLTAFASPAETTAEDGVHFAILHVALQGATAPRAEPLTLVVPRDWVEEAARALLPRSATDQGGGLWGVRDFPSTLGWVIELSPEGPPRADAPWMLTLEVPVRRPAEPRAFSGLKLVARGEEAILPDLDVAAMPTQAEPTVEFYSEPRDATTLAYGQAVALRWKLAEGVEAKLVGSMNGATERTVKGSGSETVVVLDALTYTLCAEVTARVFQPDGTLGTGRKRIERRITLDVHRPQYGFQGFVRPSLRVLPGGPLAYFWTGVNLTRLRFHVRSSVRERVTPRLDRHGLPPSAAQTLSNRSFQLNYGPVEEGERWTVSAAFDTNDPTGRDRNRVVSQEVDAVFPDQVVKATATPEKVYGMTAGRYSTTMDGPRRTITAGGDRTVEWVALATDKGLEVRRVWDSDESLKTRAERVGDKPVLGVARLHDPEQMLKLVAVVQGTVCRLVEHDLQTPGVARELTDLPENPANRFLGGTRIDVLPAGNRIYLRAREYGWSVALDGSAAHPEVILQRLDPASWEVVSLPGRHPGALGTLYALNRWTGQFLRIDEKTLPPDASRYAGTLEDPVDVARPNGRTAKLDLLQRAQTGTLDLLSGGAFNTEDGAKQPGTDRDAWEADPGCVTPTTRLIVVAGAIVARNSKLDNPSFGDLTVRDNEVTYAPQDRAYDPALDVWVRCGRLFPGVDDLAAFASTRSAPQRSLVETGGPARSSEGSVYCRASDGSIMRVQGELLEMLGFAGVDVSPGRHDRKKALVPEHLSVYTRRWISLSPDTILSPDGRLALLHDGARWVVAGPEREWVPRDPAANVGPGEWRLKPRWKSPAGAGYLLINRDAKLYVKRAKSDDLLWALDPLVWTGRETAWNEDSDIVLQDGAIIMRRGSEVIWSSARCKGASAKRLEPGDYLESPGGERRLLLRRDGTLLLLDEKCQVKWQLGVKVSDPSGLTLNTLNVIMASGRSSSGTVDAVAQGLMGPWKGQDGEIAVDATGFCVRHTDGTVWYTSAADQRMQVAARPCALVPTSDPAGSLVRCMQQGPPTATTSLPLLLLPSRPQDRMHWRVYPVSKDHAAIMYVPYGMWLTCDGGAPYLAGTFQPSAYFWTERQDNGKWRLRTVAQRLYLEPENTAGDAITTRRDPLLPDWTLVEE